MARLMNPRKLKLLFLMPFPPRLDATHGGSRVAAQLLAHLSAHHELSLICLRGADEPPVDQFLIDRCEMVEEVARPWTGNSLVQRLTRTSRLLASLMRLRPMWVTDCASRTFADCARTLVRQWQPDIIQFECHVMGQYLSALSGCLSPTLLVEYEPGIRSAPYLKHSALGCLAHCLDRLAWQRYERAVIRSVQAVVVFTERDQETVEKLSYRTPVWRIPFGTFIPDSPLNPIGKHPLSLLFVGSFIHPPNVEAAIRLVRSILPKVRRQFPDIEVVIVGDRPPSALQKTAGTNVVITGRVPDLKPYLDRAAVVVAPMRSGGGMRVKVLEALAAGKAIVATPLAVEGLNLTDGEQVLLAESDQELSEKIIQVLDDSERRASLAARAWTWACANLGWERPMESFDALYHSLVS